jgi:hypothetical protein
MLRICSCATLISMLAACATAAGEGNDPPVQGDVDGRVAADARPFVAIDAEPPPPPPLPDAEPPDAAPPPELGRISFWSGKVNVHRPFGGQWTWDDDCSSGANAVPLDYCRKFFPATASVTEVPVTSKPAPVWYDAECINIYVNDGVTEYVCNPF